MDEDAFWNIVDEAVRSGGEFETALKAGLSALEPEAILEFHRQFARRVHEAYRFDLMAVSNIVNGSVTGEDFDAFVGWLIARGRDRFETALREPSLAAEGAEPGEAKDRALWRVPAEAFRKRTGRDDFELEAQPISLVMQGERLTTEQIEERFAALVKRFGWRPSR
jgi:hypothetical protein